jgi:cell division transport system permease protein
VSEASRAKGERAATSAGLKAIWQSASELPRLSQVHLFEHLVGRAYSNMARAPLTSFLTAMTIAIALFILAGVVLCIENLRNSVSSSREDLVMSVYLKDSADDREAQALKKELSARSEIESVRLISKDAALTQFRASLGEQAFILEGLERDNPLPVTLEVKFRRAAAQEESFENIAAHYKNEPAVENVQYSRGVLRQVGAIIYGLRWGGAAAILIMFFITGFIISNTIKLALYSHREEIEIMRLVGATDWFVRAPYLIEGCIQGFLGALVGLVALYVAFVGAARLMSHSQLLQMFVPSIAFLSWPWWIALLLTGVAVGLGGSFLSVRRFSPE